MNRTLVVILALLMVPVPNASGQTSTPGAGPITLLEDPGGDVQFYASSETPPVTLPARFAQLDLRGLEMWETEATYGFQVALASLFGEDETPILESSRIQIDFTAGERLYRVEVLAGRVDAHYLHGELKRFDTASERYSRIAFLSPEADVAAATVSVEVDRGMILDHRSAKPFPGQQLAGVQVRAIGILGPEPVIRFMGNEVPAAGWVEDQMADPAANGGNGAAWTVVHGLPQTGHARLYAPDPVRASNGEATTFIFSVTAANEGPKEDTFEVAVEGAPSAWTVTLPIPVLRLGAGEELQLPVLITTPFRHQHGAVQDFVVTLTSTDDASAVGRAELAVHYVEVPQPAGHHDTLWVHGHQYEWDLQPVFGAAFNGNDGWAWMNAKQDDPLDDGVPVAAQLESVDASVEGGRVGVIHSWYLWLEPDLLMGLDFDLARLGEAALTIEANQPAIGASLSGDLLLVGAPGSRSSDERRAFNDRAFTNLASLAATEPQDIGAAARADFVTAIEPTPVADLVPYRPDSGLLLWLNLTVDRPASFTGIEQPRLVPGGTIRLPLNEYHDPVDELFATVAQVRLAASGAQERAVNPGEATLFAAELTSDLGFDAVFDLSLNGPNADWAQVMPPRLIIPAGETRTVNIAVIAPAGASHGEKADLILEAASGDVEGLRALLRLVATVDTNVDLDDEQPRVQALADEASEESPAPAFILVAVGAMGLAGAMRRRCDNG
ncbi:MAG: hypothetical protein ACPGQL_00075 [Thermoplasmatota archaeon]